MTPGMQQSAGWGLVMVWWYVSLGNWPESSDAVSRLRSNHRQMSGPGSPELLLTHSLARSLRSWQLRRIFRSAEIWDCQHKYLLRLSHHPYWAGGERMTNKSTKWCGVKQYRMEYCVDHLNWSWKLPKITELNTSSYWSNCLIFQISFVSKLVQRASIDTRDDTPVNSGNNNSINYR